MNGRDEKQQGDPYLRTEVETMLKARLAQKDPANKRPLAELLHELQVHQIELEMQNETLRQSQIALEQSRDRYIDFYDFAPVGYLTLSDKGLIAEVNLTAAEMLGMDRAKLLRRRFGQSVVAADRDRWNMHFMSALARDSRLTCEVTLSRPDGSRLDIRVDSLRLTTARNAPVLRAVLTDITERKRAENDLSVSVRFADSLIECMQNGLAVVDANGVHLQVNPALCSMTGFSREELIGSGPPHLYWPPEECEAIQAAFRKDILEEKFRSVDLTFMRKNGERFPVSLSPSVVKDAKGGVVCYMATMKDITEHKQAQEKLAEMAASLETEVMKRTSQLRALSAQLTMTEERERRMLAQDLHDDLVQLLAVIKIKLTSLVADSLRSSVDQIIRLVDQADQSARSITLQLSPPVLHTLGLTAALEWLADEMDRIYGIGVRVDSEICQKRLDDALETMLYRSARELLINVAKHATVKHASLSCMCSDGRLVLVVSDNGRGFDPAGQGGSLSGQRSFGLDSIYERIANIGGEMDIDSNPGSGTTISLSVPCCVVTRGEACDDSHFAGR